MDIIELLKSAFLGLVEGITEWLPISSTGHMILVDEFIKLNVSKTFLNMFLVVIQLGAILAVCVLFFMSSIRFRPARAGRGAATRGSFGARSCLDAFPRRLSACR